MEAFFQALNDYPWTAVICFVCLIILIAYLEDLIIALRRK